MGNIHAVVNFSIHIDIGGGGGGGGTKRLQNEIYALSRLTRDSNPYKEIKILISPEIVGILYDPKKILKVDFQSVPL